MKQKRYMALLLAGAMLIAGCTGCGQKAKTDEDKTPAAQTTEGADKTAATAGGEFSPVVDFPEGETKPAFEAVGKAKVEENTLRSGKIEILASGRKKPEDGVRLDLTPYVEIGKIYTISVEMKFTREEPVTDELGCDCELSGKENRVEVLGLEKVNSYRSVTVTGQVDTKGADTVSLRWYTAECAESDIHITKVTVRESATGPEAALKYESAYELAAQYGFSLGTVMNGTTFEDSVFTEVIPKHFNSLATANEMKAYSLLDQGASMEAAKKGNDEPQVSFALADQMMTFAKEKGMKVRGHNLVWDAYMCDWFFNEGYRSDGKKVSKKVMKKRMESYIKQVVEHFDEKFPGLVTCWDVVNEGIGDNAGTDCDSKDPAHIRTKRQSADGSYADNPFYKYVGRDYIKLAFQYARKYASPETKLFYNDYSTIYPEKRKAVAALIKELNQEEKLADGVGMQCYLDMEDGLLQEYEDDGHASLPDSVKTFSDLGVEVHLTEMTVRNYDIEKNDQHGEFYYKLFETIKALNKEQVRITNVTMWGLCDSPNASEGDYVYNLSGTYYGLFDQNYQPKQAFAKMEQSLAGQ